MKEEILDLSLPEKVTPPRGTAGRFVSMYAEKRGDAIALRLPLSLDQALRQAVDWQSKADNAVLKAWIEAAIAEKLRRCEAFPCGSDS